MINQEQHRYSIAIIGVALRFPGADNAGEFWKNLANGVESIRQFSDEELPAGLTSDFLHNPKYVRAGAVLSNVDQFDAGFFGFTPKEAATMNPQQRLFLECAWEALEGAGYDAEHFDGRIGVYGGSANNHYLTQPPSSGGTDDIAELQVMVGNDPDYLATHAAYKLNLRGPAITLQTACSTSLVAVHQAAQSLLNHECDMALAGGVTVLLPHIEGYLYVEGGINSPDGHCRAFDAQARGTVPGSGAGLVLLKRLSDAQADGDNILAVLRGTAVNNDGALKVGYTAPSVEGQADVIADALAMADVGPETISYIEAHGTGTPLGDPIEIAALNQVFRAQTAKAGSCKLGAVKSNIGHLGAAAGVAGLIKTVLALHNESIPPTLHFTKANPKIDFAGGPFVVNDRITAWPRSLGEPRRAGVSSFGIGGTNAHAIVEEAPEREPTGESRPWQLLLLSAQTPEALTQMTENLRTQLDGHADIALADVAYTLQVGRKRFEHGRLLVCRTAEDAVATLSNPEAGPVIDVTRSHSARSVVFMFPGQGSQHVDMARELYQQEDLFRKTVDECADLLRAPLGLDLRTVLFPSDGEHARATAQLRQTAITQPALFVIEYAMARLWQSWGIVPEAMIGHSIGEFVAACLAGVFSLEDALHLVAERARLMQAQTPGGMLATPMAPHVIRTNLNGELSLAAINGPEQTVVAGPSGALATLESKLTEQGVKTVALHTSHAFHSAMMDPMLEPFSAAFQKVRLNAPEIPFISNLTGTWITAPQATDPAYWVNHVRQTVNFEEGLKTLGAYPEWIVLEVGPGTALTSLATHHPFRPAAQTVLSSLPHPHDKRSALQYLLQTLGQLYLHGVDVRWAEFYRNEKRRRVPLPTYPFQRQSHWIETRRTQDSISPDRKLPLAEWFAIPRWQQSPPLALLPQLVSRDQADACLILLDDQGVGDRLAALLRRQGRTVITAAVGSEFGQVGPDHYKLSPGSAAGYGDLLSALYKNGNEPREIFLLWQLTGSVSSDVEDIQRRGSNSLLLLAQALGQGTAGLKCGIVAAANGLHAVMGDEPQIPEKSTLVGCCRVITQEFPHLSCRCADFVLPRDNRGLDQIARQLSDEMNISTGETCVAYRGARRWVQGFETVSLGGSLTGVDTLTVRQSGVYLITSALSETGMKIAGELARRFRVKLALIDSVDSFETKASHAKLQELVSLGAGVMALPADIADKAQVDKAIASAIARFGALHGVIHIPPDAADGLIQMKNAAEMGTALSIRIAGTLALAAAVESVRLDFMVLFGSTVSLSGGIGQVEECAANTFLDAYADSRQCAADPQSYVVSTIAWPLFRWSDRYEQSMAGFMSVQEQFRAQRERFGVTPEEAVDVLLRAIASRQPRLLVSPLGIQSVLDLEGVLTMEKVLEELDSRSTTPMTFASSGAALEIEDALESQIASVWQSVFGIAKVSRDDNFFALGGHSLLSIQLISRLRNVLEMPTLPLALIYEHPTVAALTQATRAEGKLDELNLEDLALSGDADLAALLAEIEAPSEQHVS